MEYRVLKIRFGSRYKLLAKKNSKKSFSYSGIIYYVIDEQGYNTQSYVQIDEECEYKSNNDELKQTYYWANQKFIGIREELLEYTKQPAKYVLTSEKTKILNDYLKQSQYFTTHLKLGEFLTGSNSPGAKKNLNNTPCLLYTEEVGDKNREYNYCKFFNFFKDTRELDIKYKTSFTFEQVEHELTEIKSLGDFFKEFDSLLLKFKSYNFELIGSDKENLEFEKMDKNAKDKYYVEGMETLAKRYEQQIIEKDTLKIRLRNIFARRVELLKSKTELWNYIADSHHDLTEKAHIIPFSDLIDHCNFADAIDPFNCLLIEPTLHLAYDRSYITFNAQGEAVYSSKPQAQKLKKEKSSLKLKDEVIKNEKIAKFIKKKAELDQERFVF